MFIIVNYIQVLFIAKLNKNLNLRNALISLIPFLFLFTLMFYETSYTYKISVYYLAIFMSLFHLVNNKNSVVRQGVIILFINYSISFIVAGVDHFTLLFSPFYTDLFSVLLGLITLVIWYLFFRAMTFFRFNLDESSSILEIIFSIISIVFSMFMCFIVDSKDNTSFYIYSNILYYLIFLSYILIFLVGRLGIYIHRTIIERENILQNDIEFQQNKLHYMRNNFEEKTITLLSELVKDKNYKKAYEVTTLHFASERRTKENIKKIDFISNNPIRLFLENKFSTLGDLSISIEINDSLFDLEIETYSYFFEILGIILDNSIEAAYKTKEKKMGLVINRPDLSTTEFIITNSATEESKRNLQSKQSNKGESKRMNGLKILDTLLQRTDIIVINNVDDVVTTRIILS